MSRLFYIVFLTFLTSPLLCGEVKLFLKPSYIVEDDVPTLGDIARISGSSSSLADIRNVSIHTAFYKDGYVDRSEIEKLLKSFDDSFTVYGSGIRLLPREERTKVASPYLIERGTNVTVRIKSPKIVIETRGKALKSAKKDEEVTIQLKNSTRIKGTVTAKNLVESDV
jgi:hypothetical protein